LRARDWALARPELGVDVVVGEEISTLNGHLLGLFLEELVPPGLTALETIARIHDQGGLAVAAHPFHPLRGVDRGQYSVGRLIPDLPLDASEGAHNAASSSKLTLSAQRGVRLRVLRGVSLTVFPGECVVLGDPSGAGKSTL